VIKLQDVLLEHENYFDIKDNLDELAKFNNDILSEYNQEFSIKSLFNDEILYSTDVVKFHNVFGIEKYLNTLKDFNESRSHGVIEISQDNLTLFEIISYLIKNERKIL
jgi:hypothetical protein